jgi:2-polyprenyl-6-methoxyphenol hydroxylase-like FAD-dependent oxidoreductase
VYGALRRDAGTLSLHEDCAVRRVAIDPPRVYTDRYGEQRFDWVVGADGIGSVARSALDPGFAPRYLGYVAVRGLVARRHVPAGMPSATTALFDDAMAKVLLEGEHVTLYGLPGGDEPLNWMWYLNVREEALERLMTDRHGSVHRWSMPAGAMHPATDAELRAMAGTRLAPWLQALVAATGTLFLQPVYAGFARRMIGSGLALVGGAARRRRRDACVAGHARAGASAGGGCGRTRRASARLGRVPAGGQHAPPGVLRPSGQIAANAGQGLGDVVAGGVRCLVDGAAGGCPRRRFAMTPP